MYSIAIQLTAVDWQRQFQKKAMAQAKMMWY
jgi:hypothetical protein